MSVCPLGRHAARTEGFKSSATAGNTRRAHRPGRALDRMRCESPLLDVIDFREPVGILPDLQPEERQKLPFEFAIMVGVVTQMAKIEHTLLGCRRFRFALGLVVSRPAAPVASATEHSSLP